MASASDSFTRSDAGTLGANWTAITAGMQIVSNRAVPNGTGAVTQHQISWYNATSFASDHYSEVVVDSSIGNIGGAVVRAQAGGSSYGLFCRPGLGTTLIGIFNNVGSFTTLQDMGVAAIDGRTQRLWIQGSTLRWYENGTQIGPDVTDSTLTGGQPGIFGRFDNVLRLDDWAAADIAGGGSSAKSFAWWANFGQTR